MHLIVHISSVTTGTAAPRCPPCRPAPTEVSWATNTPDPCEDPVALGHDRPCRPERQEPFSLLLSVLRRAVCVSCRSPGKVRSACSRPSNPARTGRAVRSRWINGSAGQEPRRSPLRALASVRVSASLW